MSFSRWLRNFRSALVPGWIKSTNRRSRPNPLATHRLHAEALEDRCLLTLNPAVGYSVLASPIDAAVGDFNGDGHLDLATVNTSQLSLLYGNGDGTFGAAQTMSAGAGLSSLAAADFNGDDKLDLATASSTTTWNGTTYVTQALVNLYLNNGNDANGNATFQAARSFSTGTNLMPGALAVGDLDNDGKVDVAAAQTNGANVTVLLGNGDGTLQTGRNFAVGANPGSVAVGDFNNDGKLDLVTANRGSNDVSLLLNNGSAGNVAFESVRNSPINGLVQSVAVGDFDDNGKLDLVATSNVVASVYWGYWGTYYDYDGYVNVLLGSGTGTFAAPIATLTSTNELGDVTVGDLNSDGQLDVVTADGFVQQYIDPTVLLGRGNGTFDSPYYFEAGAGPYAVIVADFNGDNAPDVATANFYASSVSVLMNTANWPPLGAPFVSVTSGATVVEGNDGTATMTFSAILSAPFSQAVTVDYSTSNGSALAGVDYQTKSGTVTFAAGQTSQTFEILVYGDRSMESDEFFLVNLSNVHNARVGAVQAAGYILDDEPRVSIGNATVIEGNSGTTEARFTVSLAQSYDQDVTVTFATAAGTAAAGSDFEEQTGSVTFTQGQTAKTITILVSGDRVFEQTEYVYYDSYWGYYSWLEDNETFNVNLTSTSHGVIVNGTGVGTIQDDDPRFSIGPAYSANGQNLAYQPEGNTAPKVFTFAVTMSAAYDIPVTVTYGTADNSASAGSDYQTASGTLTFIPGGPLTQNITVVVNGDRIAEGDEYFLVNLSNPTAGAVVNGQSYGNIVDDEPRFTIGDVYQNEGASGTTSFTFAVWLSAAYDQEVTVNFRTVSGTATSGNDFQAQSGTLRFAPGVTVQYITILVYGDTAKEANESFSVELTGNSSQSSIDDAWGFGYIYNDDTHPGKGKKR
jgi:hypothetical protein